MEDTKKTILKFLNQFEDFSNEDMAKGYVNVYRPSWHPFPVQFWFYPPFNENDESEPTLSNTVILLENGTIMVEDVYTGLSYDLNDCLNESPENFAYSIKEYYRTLSL